MKAAGPMEPARLVAEALGVPFVDLLEYEISPGMLRKIPTRAAIRERCVIMIRNPRRTVLVVDDPAAIPWLEARPESVGLAPGEKPSFALTTPEGLNRALALRLDARE